MPSIVPGYEYDIFISYRQNDNKRDGWVTEFVETLNDELEATIKDKLYVYFDINPHDVLHEHREVDDSIREKLKCLIFILSSHKRFVISMNYKPCLRPI